ncbi:unnamed protein product [[Candida] boidinii]|uniref:LSM2-LSM8 complex subunit LSM8 n=1 Tax=Candida boidinii TaxID=5477 RepID=A0A9W6WF21_CANBO|nr:hypothetical protein B5S33_g5238 [[Candida] boidinii]GME67616.1 unnamed protein product [[Candida] boidinii]GMF63686.1 unnamed protein product [[Candida] boidinii]GMG02604.1 unnamed protein product [[Candida] boidinii]
MSSLKEFLYQKVKVITGDGRLFIGKLEGFDQSINLILSSTIERIFDPVDETLDIELGLYIIRGDSVVCVGSIDEELENEIDWSSVRGAKLKNTKNALV